MKQLSVFKCLIGTLLIANALLLAIREWVLIEGPRYARARRLGQLLMLETVMVGLSRFLWRRLNALIKTAARGISWHRSTDTIRTVPVLWIAFTHLSFLLFYYGPDTEPHWLAVLSFVSVSIYIHLFVLLTVCWCLERMGIWLFGRERNNSMERVQKWREVIWDESVHSGCALLLALALTCFGLIVTSQPANIRHVIVNVDHFPAEANGYRIALLTDLHIGPTVGASRIEKIVNWTNALSPDLIVISGDLIDGSLDDLKGAAWPLSRLKSKQGVFYATGNHEYYHGNIDKWMVYLRQLGLRPLRNENVQIFPSAHTDRSFCLAGVDDLFSYKARISGHEMNWQKALTGCGLNETVILLCHQPNGAKVILDSPQGRLVDLVLSGHTHAGQIYVFVPMAYLDNAYFHGLYRHEASNAQVYVSAGVNFWGPPVKMFGLCEISLIQLQSSSVNK